MPIKFLIISPFSSLWSADIDKLCVEFNANRLSLGQLLREEEKSKSELGRLIKAEFDSGRLIGPKPILELVKKRFFDTSENSVLTDFPRTLEQAKTLGNLIRTDEIQMPRLALVVGTRESVMAKFKRSFRCSHFDHGYCESDEINPICSVCGEKMIKAIDFSDLGVAKNIDCLLDDYFGQNGQLNVVQNLIEKFNINYMPLD